MPEISIPNNWDPRAYQMELWRYLWGGGKRAVVRAHRRWGKDDVCLHWTATAAMMRPGTYWHCLPEYAQARKAIWQQVDPHTGKRRIDMAFPPQIRRKTNDQEMRIEFANGSTWQLVGSDSYDSLVGASPAGIVFSEYALAKPESWDFFRPMLAENGGWALFVSTVRGRNHFYQIGEYAKTQSDWYFIDSRADETGVFSPETLERERAELISSWGEDLGEAKFRQEYFNDPNVTGFLAFISGSAIEKCRKYKAIDVGAPLVWGVDVARQGSDFSVIAMRKGRAVFPTMAFRESDTMRLCEIIAAKFFSFGERPKAIFVDGVGIGAGVVDRLRQLLGPGIIIDVQAAAKAIESDKYGNKRAEMWGRMRDEFAAGVELPNDPDLLDQLTWPEMAFEQATERLLVEKKELIRKRHGASPDRAEALALTWAQPVAIASPAFAGNSMRVETSFAEYEMM